MELTQLVIAVFGFLAVVLALEGAYNLWASRSSPEAKRIASRLQALSGEVRTEVSLERVQQRERMRWLQDLINSTAPGERLSDFVKTSGLTATVSELVLLSAALALAGWLLPAFLGKPPMFSATLTLVLGVLPWWRVSSARKKRILRFEQQFPEALDLMGRAMRAGHAFPTAVKMCGEEMSEPMGRDFRILSDEMNYGVPAAEALQNLAGRVPLPDVSYFVVAVLIQREAGGNLSELLDSISSIIRQRLKLHGEIRTLSAEGKLSAYILTGLPFGVAAVVNLTNPKFMAVLWTDPFGLRMVGAAAFMMVLGILWMRSIIRIRV
ncbi:MAG: type II secretion system F family protein [Burkholderiales bacterium]|nr:type II secretion system F family protein [Burkholderiales bacterium]